MSPGQHVGWFLWLPGTKLFPLFLRLMLSPIPNSAGCQGQQGYTGTMRNVDGETRLTQARSTSIGIQLLLSLLWDRWGRLAETNPRTHHAFTWIPKSQFWWDLTRRKHLLLSHGKLLSTWPVLKSLCHGKSQKVTPRVAQYFNSRWHNQEKVNLFSEKNKLFQRC